MALGRDGTPLDEIGDGLDAEPHSQTPHARSGPEMGVVGEDGDGRVRFCTGCKPHLRKPLVRSGLSLAAW